MELVFFVLKGLAQGALAYVAQQAIKSAQRRMKRLEEKVLPPGSEKVYLPESGKVVSRLPPGSLPEEGTQEALLYVIERYEVEQLDRQEIAIPESLDIILELRVRIPAVLFYTAIKRLAKKARSASKPENPPKNGLKAVRLDSNLKR